jgi:hypothetical protein
LVVEVVIVVLVEKVVLVKRARLNFNQSIT